MGALRIAVLAPPWIPVPAPAYGGIEEVVRLLCGGLVGQGHDVTLFAPPTSTSPADVQPLLDDTHPDEIERCRWEADHVARAFAALDAAEADGRPFDVLHDHTGYAALAMADRLGTPLVHTMHGPCDGDNRDFYATHGRKATLVAISRAQSADVPAEAGPCAVVHNPLAFDEWAVGAGGDHVLWVGRMAPVKGPHRAIAAARAAGVPLVLAGPVQPGQEEFFAKEVEPHLDDDAVRYVGEVGADGKEALYGDARALLMPIRWPEPFGMVMVEAMACGTPVIAFAEGSVPEVVTDGVTGVVVEDEDAMARAIAEVGRLDRAACRDHAAGRFSVEVAVHGYERVYDRARARRRPRPGRWPGAHGGRFSPPPRAPRAVG
jgi:glycosyltransferase involved in cell wall biosynthesis